MPRSTKIKPDPRSSFVFFAVAFLLLCALVVWFFWPEISWRMGWNSGKKPVPQSTGTSKEKLSEEDRGKLDRLLKQRQSK